MCGFCLLSLHKPAKEVFNAFAQNFKIVAALLAYQCRQAKSFELLTNLSVIMRFQPEITNRVFLMRVETR